MWPPFIKGAPKKYVNAVASLFTIYKLTENNKKGPPKNKITPKIAYPTRNGGFQNEKSTKSLNIIFYNQ